jgi:hypothetical protein
MIRDPFLLPVMLPITGRGSEIQTALASLAARSPGFDAICITQPASDPRTVIDATADGVCCGCSCACWRSPSTRRMPVAVALFCMACVGLEIVIQRGVLQ